MTDPKTQREALAYLSLNLHESGYGIGLIFFAFAAALFSAILVPAFIGELATCLWLLIKGVNMKKWNERVGMGSVRAQI